MSSHRLLNLTRVLTPIVHIRSFRAHDIGDFSGIQIHILGIKDKLAVASLSLAA